MWQIKKLCDEKKIELKVFEVPCWKSYQNKCGDTPIIKRMGNSNFLIKIYNLNRSSLCDSILNPGKDWLSKNHLNYDGSVKVTAKVVEILTKTQH
jgi:hypothetical protein